MSTSDCALLLIIPGMLIGFLLGVLIAGNETVEECADCAVGNIKREWWREAIALAEYRKKRKERGKAK